MLAPRKSRNGGPSSTIAKTVTTAATIAAGMKMASRRARDDMPSQVRTAKLIGPFSLVDPAHDRIE